MLEANFDAGKAVIDAMPKKRKAIEDIDAGGGGSKMSPFEARLKEIRENNQKK